MSSALTLFQEVLRRLVLRLALLLGGRLAGRAVLLRLEIGRLPEGSRRRVALERTLERRPELVEGAALDADEQGWVREWRARHGLDR